MLSIESLKSNLLKKINKPLYLTLGMFDGFHLGHQKLIEKVNEMASIENGLSGIFTFRNHPLTVLAPYYAPPLLTTPEEKKYLARLFNVDVFAQIPFAKEIADFLPEDFTKKILKDKFNVKGVATGFNFRFGKNGSGDTHLLRRLGLKYGFKVEIIPPVMFNDIMVSSTKIREFLEDGKVEIATNLLTRPYSIKGLVVSGFHRGMKLGFPTANLKPEEEIIIPSSGVYAVMVKVKKKLLGGMMNIGVNPTFSGRKIRIEVHIFDFSDSILNQQIRVFFISRLRDECRFHSAAALKKRLNIDQWIAKSHLSLVPKDQIELCKKIKI